MKNIKVNVNGSVERSMLEFSLSLSIVGRERILELFFFLKKSNYDLYWRIKKDRQ